jgi:hypothetical protein
MFIRLYPLQCSHWPELLTRIEALLSDVLDECAAIGKSVEKNVGVLLRSSITFARTSVKPAAATRRRSGGLRLKETGGEDRKAPWLRLW